MGRGMEQEVVAIYARISRKDPEEEGRRSLQNQVALAKQWIAGDASLRNMRIEIYQDEGYTGTNMNRPAVQKLLAGIFLGKIQALVIKDFSRLSRNHLQLSELVEVTFRRHPVRLIAISEYYDSARQAGLGMGEGIKSIFYEYYCRDISGKVKKSLEAKKEAGEDAVGRLPFGYRRDGEGAWELCPEEAAVVRQIFSLSLEGRNSVRIAEQMQEAYGGSWQPSRIWRILHNPVYTGQQVWHKYENHYQNGFFCECVPRKQWRVQESRHPPVVSREEYRRVQLLHPPTAGYGKKKGRRHLFHGITKCGECKGALCRHRRRKELLVCSRGHGELSPQISVEALWRICQEIFGMGQEELPLFDDRELFLKYFIQRIEVGPGKEVRITAKVCMDYRESGT